MISEWQPIETAPKDGTQVLLYEVDEDGLEIIFVGEYQSSRDEDCYGSKWTCTEYDAFNHYPTHWMPLPKAPKL